LIAAETANNTRDWIASAIAKGEIATPCLVFDFSYVDRVLALFDEHLPNVNLYYSVKANDHPEMLRYLSSRGLGFDVASVNEIAGVLNIGAKADELILSNTIKNAQCIREIFNKRLWATTVDNERGLNALSLESTFHTHRPAVFVRVKVPASGVEINLNEKFGCTRDEAVALLIRSHELGMPPEGVHFHVGTQCKHVESYRNGIEMSMSILKEVEEETGLVLRTINIGGGFPDELVADQIGGLKAYMTALGKLVQDAEDKGFRIIAEPGRVLASGAGIAVSQVIDRNVHDGREWLYLDDGIYGLYSTSHFEKRRFDLLTFHPDDEKQIPFVVAGPTCDSLDVVDAEMLLPESMQAGDYVIAFNAGAYSISVKSNFNGMGDISTKVAHHALVQMDTDIMLPAVGD